MRSQVEPGFQMEFDFEGNFYSVSEDKVKFFNKNGDFILSFGWVGDKDIFNSYRIRDIALDKYGDVYILTSDTKGTVHKFSPTGNYIASFHQTPIDPESNFLPTRLFFDRGNNMYLLQDAKCYKFNHEQKLISKFTFEVPYNEYGLLYPIKDILVDDTGLIHMAHNSYIKTFTPEGKLIRQFKALDKAPEKWELISSFALDNKGFVYVVDQLTIRKFSKDGNLVATIPGNRGYNVSLNSKISVRPDGSEIRVGLNSDGFLKTVKIYQNGIVPVTNILSGTIYNDANSNCIKEDEPGLEGTVIEVQPGPYYVRSNKDGRFSVEVGVGEYNIKQIIRSVPGREIEQICPSNSQTHKVAFSSAGNIKADINFGNKVTLSPYLTTSVSSTRRRRCFESTTKITYANAGYAPAENAKVYLQLPKEIELLSADKPYTKQSNNTYVFDVGTVAPGETRTITIQDKVTCGDESVRGLTVCTRAWISTGKLPEKPIATVTGECDPATGRVRFVIHNTGPQDMETGKLFRIYRDGKLSTVEQYKLAGGDSLVLWIPAVGKTLRLEAEQPDGNGDNTLASATIEGCQAGGSNTPISTGFVNALPPDEEEAEAAEECLLITDSYDPNDKQVTPTGLTSENYTPTGVALTYKIRFQNTGTDVAYRVVVVDTLSENLDISTLQMGSASHNYRFDVTGKGSPVLTWTFDNIMLPDSNRNEPGSHGYIQFSIKPKADLPEKTLVENFADIFFDFNSPVRTNITTNRIYDMPEVISEADRLEADDVIATPGIIGFTPESGKFGAEVIINGKKFANEPALNKVYFNDLPATIVSATETELKVIVPANATSGNLKIQTNDGVAQSTDGFEVYQPPVVSAFSPKEGISGTTVTLEGSHLTEAWLQTIKLGNQVCEIISREGNKVVVKVPQGAVTGTFEAISKGGEAKTIDAFVVWHQPAITNLSKTTDKAGATIEIAGANFASAPERNTVKFGTVPARVLQATATVLKVQVPKGAEDGRVTIETPGGIAESTVHFTFIPAPEVLAFTPAIGTVGTDVVLTGKHFLTLGKPDTITFNGQKAVVLEATPTLLKVRVPRGASSGKIKVAGVGGYAVTADEFRIEELSPEQAIEVYPNPTTGNFTIRFIHADFEVQQVQLFSTLGQLVYSEKVNSPRPDQLEIKLATPKPGMYMLHIKTERGLVIKKLNVL
ncbi:DUF7619 domain-containing protein [Pontibacter pudoricolor]|uniref:DUF7619 domain-containing protein n=1 Tax=Pontibacter pudoricolor TaxID=2694930 RepID=UPI001EE4DBF1|nr:IPT/TIG domain-containing protein [Pontibacter pudoricolor]